MKCELCGSSRRDSIKYGEFLTKKGKGVHTNCLYLSSGIVQNGKDDEGILGFLPKDIAAEKKRVSTIRCCYCGEVMANIGCCERRCHLNFHMICGIENGAMNQFVNSFRSFCHRHVRKINYRPKTDDKCCICFEKIFNESTRFSVVNMIRAPCCRNGWFHKYCLQQFAKNAGYFFKCPLCNDSTKFKQNMSLSGIFVQNKDAEWEMVPNAYAELLERPSVCAAETCHNTKGRGKAQTSNNPFVYCETCGSVAMHLHCTPQRSRTFECDNCKSILHANSGLEAMEAHRQFIEPTDGDDADKSEDDNSDIDVCGSISEEEVDNVITQRAYIENENSTQIKEHVDGLNYSDDTTIECQMQLAYLCSDDEIQVDAVEEQENVINMQDAVEHKVLDVNATIVDAAINSAESQDSEENYASNISCVAQRTRRKSVATYIPAFEDQVDEDNKSTSSYKSSECCQVFEYDDGSDAANDNTKNHVCSTDLSNEKITNPLDTSCIANRTRRRSMKKIEVKSEEKNICEDSDTYEYITVSSHNSYQPSQGSTFKSECYEGLDNQNGQQNGNGEKHGNNLMTYFYQLLNEVKSNPQTKHTQTEKNNVENVDEIEVKSDPLNTSCIAKRTRRRLSSVNVIDTIKEKGEEAQDSETTTNSVTSSQDSYKSSMCFGSTTEHQTAANTDCPETDTASIVKRTHSRKRSHDSAIENATVYAQTNTICKNRALTSNDIRPASSNVLTSPAFRRGQRRYLPSRRLIESADMYKTHKSLLGRSPVTKYENWSNIKESSAAYFTPNFIRVNGKLKSALKESAQQQKKPRQTAAAQTHFSRSYQLLLECNENHYASTSANAQRV
ncbi:uncharacterized protein LOC105223541 [Bactrocera dorsalis]|uniref:Uncharacterized protein LOC105223541 n=1 Tax=Bactrocera dorsalis TaxID=27457 RepID=A0A6I9UW73_BACDO|nr:uncharacterized protein LOC105223541 [Bactrocera dorsalis]